ncbi:hypothetical protein L2D25_24200 [Salmonella enterica subsp. enterica serovar Muenchen]|uniref:hypothetical protein n=1 Tax=Salmonella enterica TaxID=28901 RepID=UPI001F0E4CD2|nr:hypothetical protein [Salmonella enterica]MCH5444503.1 hypothetical protein [Salmonella enterica subsp. enterica serovar Muenchen]
MKAPVIDITTRRKGDRSPFTDHNETVYTGGTSGGGGGSKMESRVAKLESDVAHIDSTLQEMKDDMREMRRDLRSDFRILFGSLITVAIGLAGIMARGFHWL